MISYILKVIRINRKFSVEFLSVLFEYPKDYFEKLYDNLKIDQNTFPKNNPSGMPWNLTSINIIKLLVFIARTIFDKNGTIVSDNFKGTTQTFISECYLGMKLKNEFEKIYSNYVLFFLNKKL